MKMWLPATLLLAGQAMANILETRQTKESTLKADTQCSTYMCISGTINGSVEQYVLSSTGQQKPGWMSIGFGKTMIDSPMVILWSNSDGSVTLSQRQASDHVMPTVVNNPTRAAFVENSLTTTSGDKIQFAFSVASSGESSPDIIWAYGDTNPGSSAKDAKIKIHVDKGTAKLKFAATSGTTGGTTGGTTSSGNSHPAGGGGPGQAGSPSTNTTSPGGTTASKGTSSGSTASSGNSTSSGTNNSSTLSPSSCGMLMVSALVCGLLVLIY